MSKLHSIRLELLSSGFTPDQASIIIDKLIDYGMNTYKEGFAAGYADGVLHQQRRTAPTELTAKERRTLELDQVNWLQVKNHCAKLGMGPFLEPVSADSVLAFIDGLNAPPQEHTDFMLDGSAMIPDELINDYIEHLTFVYTDADKRLAIINQLRKFGQWLRDHMHGLHKPIWKTATVNKETSS